MLLKNFNLLSKTKNKISNFPILIKEKLNQIYLNKLSNILILEIENKYQYYWVHKLIYIYNYL